MVLFLIFYLLLVQQLRTKGDKVLIILIPPGQQSLQAFSYLVQYKPALVSIFGAARTLYSSVMCL